MKELKDVMAEHPFLRGMARAQVEVLATTANEAEFRAGEMIFHEAQPAYQFYLLLEGKVAVESSLSNDPDITVQVLGAGEALGWS